MTHAQSPPKTIGELIDEVERIREDLFRLQSELEKIEIVETAISGERKEAYVLQCGPCKVGKAWTGEDRGNQSPRI